MFAIMKKYQIFYLGILVFAFAGMGCESDEDPELQDRIRQDDKAIQSYLTEKNISAEKASSWVYIEPLVENAQGKQVQEGDVVSVLYTMKLLIGEYEVESHTDTLHPVKFSHTEDALIPVGLNAEISRMREGEKFRFFIPSHQAFGDYRHQNLFSAHSNFIMEVEVIDLKTEPQQFSEEIDSIESYIQHNNIQADAYADGLHFVDEKPGNGRIPNSNGAVRFHFTRKYLDGTVIETTQGGDPIQVYFSENRLVEGLEAGIKLMREGGEAILIMPSSLAFGKSIQIIPQKVRQDLVDDGELEPEVKPYAPVLYEVQLLGIY
jgi:FKBP-type peptidyl-prolyl cis-trans isomerase